MKTPVQTDPNGRAPVSSESDFLSIYELCHSVYKVTKNYPEEEKYGLISQMRRCAVSIPSNIAEGYRRVGRKEYIQFLRIALGS